MTLFRRFPLAVGASSALLLGLAAAVALAEGEAKEGTEGWTAPRRAALKKNPVSADEAAVKAGRRIYIRECLSCHGSSGKGDGEKAKELERKPGDLTDPSKTGAETDGALFWKISTGRKPMPGFETTLSEEEIWKTVLYLRDLAKPAAGDTPSVPPVPPVTMNAKARAAALVERYLTLLGAIGREDLGAAHEAAASFVASLEPVPAGSEDPSKILREAGGRLQAAPGLTEARDAFHDLSAALVEDLQRTGVGGPTTLFVYECPNVRGGKGGVWVQPEGEAKNPYQAGDAPPCAHKVREIPAAPTAAPVQTPSPPADGPPGS